MFATNRQPRRPRGGRQMPAMAVGSAGLFFLRMQMGEAVDHLPRLAECHMGSSLV